MSFTLPPGLRSLKSQRARPLARLWKISRKDATQFRFTDHSSSIEYENETYNPQDGLSASATERQEATNPQNVNVRGAISSSTIAHADLEAGLFAEAEVVEYLVDPRFPWAGTHWTLRYWLTDASFNGEEWQAELQGASAWLSYRSGRLLGRDCDADLFDARCKVLTTQETWFEITGVRVLASSQDATEPRRKFDSIFADIPTTGPETDEYKHGNITWTTGANLGLESEIKAYTHTPRSFELYEPTKYVIADNDEFTLQTGCSRLRSVCINKFDNLNNFRGIPYMPGSDEAMRAGGT